MLETKCCQQPWDIGDEVGRFRDQHPLSFNMSIWHQNSKDVTNIEILSLTPSNCRQHQVTNIHVPPKSILPVKSNKYLYFKLAIESDWRDLNFHSNDANPRNFKVERKFDIKLSPNPLLMYSANTKDSQNADRLLADLSFSIVH